MDQSGSTGSEAPLTPPPAEPAPTTQWAPPPAPVQAGPAGFVYADVPNRAIAYILDAILIGIVNIIVFAILAGDRPQHRAPATSPPASSTTTSLRSSSASSAS